MTFTKLKNILLAGSLALSLGCTEQRNCPEADCPDLPYVSDSFQDTETTSEYDSWEDTSSGSEQDPNEDLKELIDELMDKTNDSSYTESSKLKDECQIPYYEQTRIRDEAFKDAELCGTVDCTGEEGCIIDQQMIYDLMNTVPNLPIDIRVHDKGYRAGFNATSYPAYTIVMNKDLLTAAHYTALAFFTELEDDNDSFIFKEYIEDMLDELNEGVQITPPPETTESTPLEILLLENSFVGGVLAHEVGHAYHEHYEKMLCAMLDSSEHKSIYDIWSDQYTQAKLSRLYEFQADFFATEFLMNAFTDEDTSSYVYVEDKDAYQKYTPFGYLLGMHVIRILNEGGVPTPFDSHPPAEERIEVIKTVIQESGWANQEYLNTIEELEEYVYTK